MIWLVWLLSNKPTPNAFKKIQNRSFYRNYLNAVFINSDYFGLSCGFSEIYTAVSVYIASCVSANVLCFHVSNITGKQKTSQDLQRLNGEGAFNAHAIVRTAMKVVEMGLTRPSAYIVL